MPEIPILPRKMHGQFLFIQTVSHALTLLPFVQFCEEYSIFQSKRCWASGPVPCPARLLINEAIVPTLVTLLHHTNMATIHPSRMGLIKEDMRGPGQRVRSSSPRRSRRSRSPSPRRDRSHDRDRERGRDRPPHERDERDRDGRSDRRDEPKDGSQRRRLSPQYDDYRRPPPIPNGPPPPGDHRQPPEHIYPPHGERRGYHGGAVSSDFLERFVYFI